MKDKASSKYNYILASLDIGSSKIVCLVGKNNNEHELEVLGSAFQTTKSIKKGQIVDPLRLQDDIKSVVSEVGRKTQTAISSVIINSTVTNAKSNFLEGKIEVGGEQVDDLHIKSVINNSDLYKIDDEYQSIHEIIRYFDVDDKKVSEPKNFFANQLKANIYQLLITKNYYRSLNSVIKSSGLSIDHIVATPFASSLATLIEDEKELGTICIDLGAGITSICIIENNRLMFADAIPVGGNNITYDLASGLTTSIENAERLKTLYGSALSNPSDEYELIDVPIIGSNKNNFNQINRSIVNSFIKPRIEETLEMVRQKLKDYNLHNKKYRRVVLTGGGSLLEGIDEYAKIIFDSQVRLAGPSHLKGIKKEIYKPQFSTAIGLLINSQNNNEIGELFPEKRDKLLNNGIFSRFSSWLDTYI